MKNSWMLILIFMLVGCGNGSNTNVAPDPVMTGIPSLCIDDSPATVYCGTDPNLKNWDPTAISFGDSIDLGRSVAARHDLCGLVDYRHHVWEQSGIDICGSKYVPYFIGQFLANSTNDGCALSELDAMRQQFATMPHFNVILFSTAVHDFQQSHLSNPCGRDTPDQFRNNLEAVMDEVQGHGDYIIWIDSPPIGPNTAGIQVGEDKVINQIGDELAREHGYYILEMNIDPLYHLSNDVHFTGEGYSIMGQWVADCVVTALNQQETDICHH